MALHLTVRGGQPTGCDMTLSNCDEPLRSASRGIEAGPGFQLLNHAASVAPFIRWSMDMKTLALKERAQSLLPAVAAVAVVSACGAGAAFAGADATFNTALAQFTGFLEGSGGKIITVLSLAGGIVALASGRFSLGQVAIPVGVGVGAGTGVPIVTSTITATI